MNPETESASFIPRKTAVADMISIALVFSICIIITNPIGDFPLVDDWSYGRAVVHLIKTGEFQLIGWVATTLFTNVLWGTLFCIPAGFSFNALRLSTLTMSFLGIFATYMLLRELRLSRLLTVVAALTLTFSPLYYMLSFTFMTDIPYIAMITIAAIFFIRNLTSGSDLAIFYGTILAVAATLSRQLAISVPIAFAITFIWRNGISKRNVLRAVIPPILCIGALLIFYQWLAKTGRFDLEEDVNIEFFQSLKNPMAYLYSLKEGFHAFQYLGLFLLPIIVLVFGSIVMSRRKILLLLIASTGAVAIGAIGMTFMAAGNHLLIPTACTIIMPSGFGPLTLHDAEFLHLNIIPSLPAGFWIIVTIASLVGAVLLITIIGYSIINLVPKLLSIKMEGHEAAGTFILLSTFIYLFPILIYGFNDRYMIGVLPFLMAGIANVPANIQQTAPKVCRFIAVTLIVAFASFAICGTRDYLTWNRLRWEALHYLMDNQHIKAENIDGGLEFNGWYLYDRKYDDLHPKPGKSWWWVQKDTYRIGFGSMPGYSIIKEYKYFHWMPPHIGTIAVLKEDTLETPNVKGNKQTEQD